MILVRNVPEMAVSVLSHPFSAPMRQSLLTDIVKRLYPARTIQTAVHTVCAGKTSAFQGLSVHVRPHTLVIMKLASAQIFSHLRAVTTPTLMLVGFAVSRAAVAKSNALMVVRFALTATANPSVSPTETVELGKDVLAENVSEYAQEWPPVKKAHIVIVRCCVANQNVITTVSVNQTSTVAMVNVFRKYVGQILIVTKVSNVFESGISALRSLMAASVVRSLTRNVL